MHNTEVKRLRKKGKVNTKNADTEIRKRRGWIMEERCDVGKIINRISHQLKRRMNCHEEEDSLTNMQRHVLHYILLQSMSRDIYQKDVEAEFQIRRSTATGILQLLEKNGFILRKAEDRDARLKKIVPTEKAEKVREHVLMNIDRTEKIIHQGIPDEKMAVCIETLELISANLFEDEKCCTEKQKPAAAGAV